MTTAVITTTIHESGKIGEWARLLGEGDFLVIAEDHKTPRDSLRRTVAEWGDEFGFTPIFTYQEKTPYECSDHIGWNTIQRRNMAYLRALEQSPDIIVTIDDDNGPANREYLNDIRRLHEPGVELPVCHSTSSWYNVGQMLVPVVTHRGFPLSQRHRIPVTNFEVDRVSVGVHASLWIGDPDIDAVERIHADPVTAVDVTWPTDHYTFALAENTWCPFNSQATAYLGETTKLLILPPGLGRYDDIWGSYITRRVMDHLGYSVSYGVPMVYQDRNPHNLLADLRQELFGMEHTDAFTEALRGFDLTGGAALDCLEEICDFVVDEVKIPLPESTMRFLRVWPSDVRRAVSGG